MHSLEKDTDFDYEETVKIKELVRQTDKAYLVELPSGFQTFIPKSQCNADETHAYMPSWLLEKIKYEEKKAAKTKHVKREVECRRCFTKAVTWQETEDGWRLFNKKDETLHVCYDKVPQGIR